MWPMAIHLIQTYLSHIANIGGREHQSTQRFVQHTVNSNLNVPLLQARIVGKTSAKILNKNKNYILLSLILKYLGKTTYGTLINFF